MPDISVPWTLAKPLKDPAPMSCWIDLDKFSTSVLRAIWGEGWWNIFDSEMSLTRVISEFIEHEAHLKRGGSKDSCIDDISPLTMTRSRERNGIGHPTDHYRSSLANNLRIALGKRKYKDKAFGDISIRYNSIFCSPYWELHLNFWNKVFFGYCQWIVHFQWWQRRVEVLYVC